jgi:hypothetical protein
VPDGQVVMHYDPYKLYVDRHAVHVDSVVEHLEQGEAHGVQTLLVPG